MQVNPEYNHVEFEFKGTLNASFHAVILITDNQELCEKFNTFFFINVGKEIGKNEGPLTLDEHPSIQAIRANISSSESEFHFKPVDEAKVTGYLGRVGLGKVTELDTISSKILHLAKDVVIGPTASLVNRMIADGRFPASSKEARVSPVFKKKDSFDVQNYRPISILHITSKIFERALEEQLSEYFEKHFNPYLSAFRKGFSCQSVIVCACPYSSNIGLSAMTLYYPVQDKTSTRPVNTQNYYTKI